MGVCRLDRLKSEGWKPPATKTQRRGNRHVTPKVRYTLKRGTALDSDAARRDTEPTSPRQTNGASVLHRIIIAICALLLVGALFGAWSDLERPYTRCDRF